MDDVSYKTVKENNMLKFYKQLCVSDFTPPYKDYNLIKF